MNKLAVLAIAMGVLVACGPPPVRTADIGPLAIPPATVAPPPPAPPATPRPKEVAGWLHIDDPNAVLDVVGMVSASWAPLATPWTDLIDTRQPIDVVVVADGERMKDTEVAVRIAFRDTKALLDKLTSELHVTIKEDGDKIHFKKHEESTEDELVCEIGPSRGAEIAVCGTPKGVEATAEWLRSAPAPAGDETARAGKAQPIMRAVVYGEALRPLFAESDGGSQDKDEKDAILFVRDMKTLALELGRDGSGLAFAATVRLASAGSEFAKDLFTPPGAAVPDDAFFRVWQDTSAAIFLPGGGALPKYAKKILEPSYDSAPKAASARTDAIAKLVSAMDKPVIGGYGIRTDRARAALAAVRSAKDPEKATHTLEQALDAYYVYRLSMDLPKAEATMKGFVSVWNAEDEASSVYSGSRYDSRPMPKKGAKKAPRWATRVAPAKLGLPKGSFFIDETKVDWHTYAAAMNPATAPKTAPKPDIESTLFVPDPSGATWAASGPDDAACADTAKKLLSTTKPKAEEDGLFKRKGLLAAGYVSSLVGAFALHKATISMSSMTGSGSSLPSSSALAEIEHDLATPRQPLPFVLTAQKQGEGGIATFEIRGERDAFKTLGEHLGESIFGGASIFFLMAMMGGFGGHP